MVIALVSSLQKCFFLYFHKKYYHYSEIDRLYGSLRTERKEQKQKWEKKREYDDVNKIVA